MKFLNSICTYGNYFLLKVWKHNKQKPFVLDSNNAAVHNSAEYIKLYVHDYIELNDSFCMKALLH